MRDDWTAAEMLVYNIGGPLDELIEENQEDQHEVKRHHTGSREQRIQPSWCIVHDTVNNVEQSQSQEHQWQQQVCQGVRFLTPNFPWVVNHAKVNKDWRNDENTNNHQDNAGQHKQAMATQEASGKHDRNQQEEQEHSNLLGWC